VGLSGPGRLDGLRNRGKGVDCLGGLGQNGSGIRKRIKFLLNILGCYLNEFKYI
jgi:hypothetical protein